MELLAATGTAPLPTMIGFSRLLQGGPGVAGFALQSHDLERDWLGVR